MDYSSLQCMPHPSPVVWIDATPPSASSGTRMKHLPFLVLCMLLLHTDCKTVPHSSDTWVSNFEEDVSLLQWTVCSQSKSSSSYLAVVNSRHVYRLNPENLSTSSADLDLRGEQACVHISLRKQAMSIGSHVVALYADRQTSTSSGEGKPLELIDLHTFTKSLTDDESTFDLERDTDIDLAASTKPLVGILYSTWHAPLGAFVMQDCAKKAKAENSTCPTTEYVIQNSNAGNDSIRIKNLSSSYNVTPKKGFYCIYRKRPDDKNPPLPDCANITETLTQHAKELLSTGIDFVILDATNLDQWPNEQSDTVQLRPTEVLFEEWAKLRKSGINTPKIVVWNLARNTSVLWKQYLDRLYNNPDYQDLLLFNERTGKKIFMVVDSASKAPTQDVLSAIESNGGHNDIDIIKAWAQLPPSKYTSGTWTFFTPCGGEQFSTTVQSMTECNQLLTVNSPMGTAMAVSPSYQMAYASAPFQAPSSLGGYTFKIQFATGLNKMPENFFISSYNEFLTGPRQDAFGGKDKHPYVTSVGLEWDPDRYSGWVDTYGAFRSRNIEPTEEYGDLFYDILSSCFRVVALNAAANKTGCNVQGEDCCNITTSQLYKPIWSLSTIESTPANKIDYLLTDSESERNQKIAPSGGYREIKFCTATGSTSTTFCYNGSLSTTIDAARGPFILFSESASDTNRLPLYRCMGASSHFFSNDKECEGGGKMESLLGWTSSRRNSETARSLHRCLVNDSKNSNHTYHYPLLDNGCPQGVAEDKVMGYVV